MDDSPRQVAVMARTLQVGHTIPLHKRRLEVPMPRDERALRVARALLDDSSIDYNLDRWADQAGASRRTLARIFRSETGLGFAEWRARLRAVDGLARLSAMPAPAPSPP